MNKLSILYPDNQNIGQNNAYKLLSDTTCHDLGLDSICKLLSKKENEQHLIMRILSQISDDPTTANFRADVFEDIMRFPAMRTRIMELLDKIQFLRDFGSFKTDYDKKAGIWDLLHRLEEINDYIECVEALRECLSATDIHSEGLINLRANIEKIYNDSYYAQMKADIKNLKADTSSLKSITVGININERFEVSQIGVISVNNKPFKHSNILSNFSQAVASGGNIGHTADNGHGISGVRNGNEWNGDMHYTPVEDTSDLSLGNFESAAMAIATHGFSMAANAAARSGNSDTLAGMPDKDAGADITHYMSKVVGQMLSATVKKLRDVLSNYVNVTITTITDLIPEFVYYIRFAEFIENNLDKNMKFCKAVAVSAQTEKYMSAQGFYNLKLATTEHSDEIVVNDLDFDLKHMIYILTGANRGGKTTVTQAVGLLYVLAQGGIYVPAESFEYVPVDCIYTHFPADEDKTMNLGRLGEECTRFKELFEACTDRSLLLLNETFSTTSFEEGYYIARDCVRAVLNKGIRTIYNTHMHKLAGDIDEINSDAQAFKVASLIVKSEEGKRSFKIEVAPPEGMSYAKDIADKYGVTYEALTKNA